MICISVERCIGCGACVKVCHEACITLVGRVAQVNHALCSTCTQCIAICPQQALSWDQTPPIPFDETRLPSAEQISELLQERRSIRFFEKGKIERALLNEIVGCGAYAPTNNYTMRALVLDDPKLIAACDRISAQVVATIYKLLYKPRLVFSLLRRLTPAFDPRDKVKMEAAMAGERTYDYPAAIVFMVGDSLIAHSEASAQYALYNMMLYAQAQGVGCCLYGGGKLLLDRSRAARKLLGLRRGEHILGAVWLGYPAVRFRNKAQGKALPIQWNNG